MENITLKPATNPIDEFDQYYKFLSVQVVTELARRAMYRKIMLDTTPARVEDTLQSAIIDVLQRFEIYDEKRIVAYGYKLDAGEVKTTKAIITQHASTLFAYPIAVRISRYDKRSVYISADRSEKLLSRIKSKPMEMYPVDNISKGVYSDQLTTEMLEDVRKHADDTIKELVAITDGHIFSKRTELDIGIAIFRVIKKVASISQFSDMNITVEEVVKMLYGDLMEEAIRLEREADEHINSRKKIK